MIPAATAGLNEVNLWQRGYSRLRGESLPETVGSKVNDTIAELEDLTQLTGMRLLQGRDSVGLARRTGEPLCRKAGGLIRLRHGYTGFPCPPKASRRRTLAPLAGQPEL